MDSQPQNQIRENWPESADPPQRPGSDDQCLHGASRIPITASAPKQLKPPATRRSRNRRQKGTRVHSNTGCFRRQLLPTNLAAERVVLGVLIEEDELLPEVIATGLK